MGNLGGFCMVFVDLCENEIAEMVETFFRNGDGVSRIFTNRAVGEIVEQGFGHAVGACSDDQPHHSIDTEGFFVFSFEIVESCIGIGICLKVGKVFHHGIFPCKELLTFFELLTDGLVGVAVCGIEGLVVAIGTSTLSYPSVTIGTGETSIDGNLLCLAPQLVG